VAYSAVHQETDGIQVMALKRSVMHVNAATTNGPSWDGSANRYQP
jgi:hypothetical protein